MKKMCVLLFALMLIVPGSVFALSASTRLDYKGGSNGVYKMIITLQNASDVTKFSANIDVEEGTTINDDITCSDGSSCTIVDGVLEVSNENGLSDEICNFTIDTGGSAINLSLSNSTISDASGNSISVYNPSTVSATVEGDNPATGIVDALTLLLVLLLSSIIFVKVLRKNRFQNI